MQIQARVNALSLKPAYAFVVYQAGRSQYSSEPSALHTAVHEIKEINGHPTLMPGRLMNESDLAAMCTGMNVQNALPQWLDDHIVAKGPDRMIWYTPPGLRSMFFETSAHVQPAITGNATLAVPGLVWMRWGKSLYVYATKSTGRPERETQLHQAPFFNVWSRGKVCIGSAEVPDMDRFDDPVAWEQMFFGSRFTHPNFTEKDRLIKGDPTVFWASQFKKPSKAFPLSKLAEFPLTVADLLRPDLADALERLPKAKGEF